MKITKLVKFFPKTAELTLCSDGIVIGYIKKNGDVLFKAAKDFLDSREKPRISTRQLVRKWYAKSESKNIKDCIKELHISYNEVYKYWPEAKSLSGKNTQTLVLGWQKTKPNGLCSDCARDLGLDKNTVSRWFDLEKDLEKYQNLTE